MRQAVVFILFVPCIAWTHWSERSSIGFQSFGYAGQINLFFSYSSENQKWQHDLGLGVSSPNSKSEIYQLNYKFKRPTSLRKKIYDLSIVPFYWGILFSYTGKKNFFIFSPARYDEPTYYENSALRWNLVFGMSIIKKRKNKKIEYYFEAVFQDYLLIHMLNNPKSLRPQDTMSLGFGVKTYLF